jgi:hypothetical protein
MANYWVKTPESGAVRGPFSGSQLKAMALNGELAGSELVSVDQTKWSPAERVKGLFPVMVEPTPASQKPAQAIPPRAETTREAASPPPVAPPQPTAAFSPIPFTPSPVKPRNVRWFLISAWSMVAVAVLLIGPTVINTIAFIFAGSHSSAIAANSTLGRLMAASILLALALRVIATLAALSLGVYFVVWVYQVHEDMRRLTAGAYPISPGQACGFCFIPFFNLYWIVAMPWKLAVAIDRELGGGSSPTSPTRVMVFQILQQVAPLPFCCLFVNVGPIFFALSMMNIQTGMNELIARRDPNYVPPEPLPPTDLHRRMPRWGWIIAGTTAVGLLLMMTPAVISMVVGQTKALIHTEEKEVGKLKEKNAHQSSHADAESPATPPAPVAPASANSGPPLSDETNGLLALTDPASQTRSGKWFVQNRALSSSGVGTEVIGIPALLPAEFDLTMDFVRLTGDEDIAVQVKSGEIHFMLLIGASHNTRMGVDLPGKKRLSASPEAFKGKNLILPTVPQELVLKVRNGSVRATLNGTQTYSITADRGSWTVPTNWQAAKNDTLAVGTRNSSVEFHSLRVVPAPAE